MVFMPHLFQFCEASCRAQAWSDGCILEVLYDLERIETANRPSIIDFQGSLIKEKENPKKKKLSTK